MTTNRWTEAAIKAAQDAWKDYGPYRERPGFPQLLYDAMSEYQGGGHDAYCIELIRLALEPKP